MENLIAKGAFAVVVLSGLVPASHAGTYAPAAGVPGSTALYKDDEIFAGWATGWTNYLVNGDENVVTNTFRTPEKALGKAVGDAFDIVSIGRGGQITVTFDVSIADGAGFDFAVFENALDDYFLELAYVEVSSDGTNFFRFANDSLTTDPVGAYEGLDPTDVTGFAGKYRQGYGTPFDLNDLASVSPLLNVNDVRWVRLVDVVGDGSDTDTNGDPVYDPFPTIGSAGFDLDAVGVIHFASTFAMDTPAAGSTDLRWHAHTNRVYHVECNDDLSGTNWVDVGDAIVGDDQDHTLVDPIPIEAARFYRLIEGMVDP